MEYMDARDFLDLGMELNEGDAMALDRVARDIARAADGPEKEVLSVALKRRRTVPLPCKNVDRVALLELCRGWNTLSRGSMRDAAERRAAYEAYVCDEISWEKLISNSRSIEKFHKNLQKFARAEEPHPIILALLRVQEATAQYAERDSLNQIPPDKKWAVDKYLKTKWAMEKPLEGEEAELVAAGEANA